jgi:hypothetical protein
VICLHSLLFLKFITVLAHLAPVNRFLYRLHGIDVSLFSYPSPLLAFAPSKGDFIYNCLEEKSQGENGSKLVVFS